jgi:hypothetical protein
MNLVTSVFRRLGLLTLACGSWLAVAGTVWAAPPIEPVSERNTAGYWVFPYTIVILSIALGMLVVCRTARRSERARPQKYEELKTAK